MIIMRYALLVVSVATVVAFAGCSRIEFHWQYQEVKRVASPDHEVEAVIVDGDAGAVTPNTTFVFIVSAGRPIDTNHVTQSEAIFRADHLKGLNVVWKQPHLLAIQYDQARISQFNNLWDVLNNRKYAYPVETRLEPSSPDFSTPPNDRTAFPVNM